MSKQFVTTTNKEAPRGKLISDQLTELIVNAVAVGVAEALSAQIEAKTKKEEKSDEWADFSLNAAAKQPDQAKRQAKPEDGKDDDDEWAGYSLNAAANDGGSK